MSLTATQSNKIVKDCIKDLSGSTALVKDRLEDVGFPDQAAVDRLLRKIVQDKVLGVKAFRHTLQVSALAASTSATRVGKLADEVEAKAVEPKAVEPKAV
jgi:hypothetical protein